MHFVPGTTYPAPLNLLARFLLIAFSLAVRVGKLQLDLLIRDLLQDLPDNPNPRHGIAVGALEGFSRR
jgi:hypothetical protein